MHASAWPRPALLCFRTLVAALIGIHGWYRLLHGGSPPFGEWLASQGVPGPHLVAWGITFAEVIGSACLALGVCVRPFACLFMLVYATGIALLHAHEGWFVVGAGRNGSEYSVLLIASLALIATAIRNPLWRATRRRA